uniref:Uncharacterized protein n=1 Tax=Oryza punctata TaxID=4537 RepID=A0A0E0LV44_ORYPU
MGAPLDRRNSGRPAASGEAVSLHRFARRATRIALFDLVNHDGPGAAPPPLPSASRYTLSVAFGDEGLRMLPTTSADSKPTEFKNALPTPDGAADQLRRRHPDDLIEIQILVMKSTAWDGWMMIVPMILPQVMQLLPQAYCLCLLNHEIGATIRRDSPIARNLPGNL